jgi:hypothetical protein
MKSSEHLGASAPEPAASSATIVGIWAMSVAVSAGIGYLAREWFLFLLIGCFVALMTAFVPKRPVWRAVTSGIAVGVMLALAVAFQ